MSGSEGNFHETVMAVSPSLFVCIVQNLCIDRAALKLSFSFYS